MGNWSEGHMNDGWGLAMVLGMIGLALLVAVAVGLAVLWTNRLATAPSRPAQDAAGSARREDPAGAEQILATRMARGEIDTEDYRARLDALRAAGPR